MLLEDAIALIENSNGKIITVDFIKRTTGELRTMNCRLGVRKHLKGGELAYDPKEKGLITVFDMQKAGYRSIATESIQRITIGGETHQIENCQNV